MKKELDFFYIGDSYGGNQDWCLDHMMQLGGCGAITACDCSIYFKLRMGEEKAYPGNLTEPIFPEDNAPARSEAEKMPAEKAVTSASASANASTSVPVSSAASSELDSARLLPEINLPKPAQVVDGDITMPECPKDAPFYEGPGAALGIDRDTYIRFTEVMKPYLHPRWSGIDKLYLFTEGLARYYEEQGVIDMEMEEFDGGNDVVEAIERVKEQINAGYPIPCLILNHRNPAMEDYIWHWFLLVGYETKDTTEVAEEQENHVIMKDGTEAESGSMDDFYVKTATYSEADWVRFSELWNTGYPVKGGLILFKKTSQKVHL